MKNKILSLLMSVASILTLSGCSSDKKKEAETNRNIYKVYSDIDAGHWAKDLFIVLNQNDIDILHKGSAKASYHCNSTINVVFDCGEMIISNADYSISITMPKESRYDEICEECFERE